MKNVIGKRKEIEGTAFDLESRAERRKTTCKIDREITKDKGEGIKEGA